MLADDHPQPPDLERAVAPLAALSRQLVSEYDPAPGTTSWDDLDRAMRTVEARQDADDDLPLVLGKGSGRLTFPIGDELVAKVPWNLVGLIDNLCEVACWLSMDKARASMMTPVGLWPSLLLVTGRAKPLWPAWSASGDTRETACEKWLGPINALRERSGLPPDDLESLRLENYGLHRGELVVLDLFGGSPSALAYAFKCRRRNVLWTDDDALADYVSEAPRLEARHERSGWGRGPTAPLTVRGIARAAGWEPGSDWPFQSCGLCDSGKTELECCVGRSDIHHLVYR